MPGIQGNCVLKGWENFIQILRLAKLCRFLKDPVFSNIVSLMSLETSFTESAV